MRAVYLFVFALMLGLSACNWGVNKNPKADITTDTLTYAYKSIKQRAADCGNKPDSGCTVVKIKYPKFNDTVLNDTIAGKLIHLIPLDNAKTSNLNLSRYGQSFLESYTKAKKTYKNGVTIYTLNTYAKIIRQDSSLTTLEVGGYVFQSGARGFTATTFINWNTKAKRDISLDDIMVSGYNKKLTAIADSIFRKQEKLTADASLTQDYFFRDAKFALNQNYSINPLGIRFLYNQNEIKPYAAGQTELLIPYAKIKSLLRPNTVVSQYIK